MKQNVVDKILEILKERDELEALSVSEELSKRKCKITYDTISKYLKEMAEKGLIKRKAKASPYSDGRKHWNYHYSLKC